MHRATRELRESGIAGHVVSVGQVAPDFLLESSGGAEVGLEELRTRGPVVLTFYRGHW